MTAVAIVQARMGSSRLPGKILRRVGDTTVLGHVLRRLDASTVLEKVVVATTDHDRDDPTEEFSRSMGVPVTRGSEHDVLARYIQAASDHDASVVVRVTADCPLIDAETVGRAIALRENEELDYVSAGTSGGFPRGLDVEVVTIDALRSADTNAIDEDEREHVTLHIYRRPATYRIAQLQAPSNLARPEWRLCVDEPPDLALIRTILQRLHAAEPPMEDVVRLLDSEPSLLAINRSVSQTVVDRTQRDRPD